jgi:putative ABC transport system substrate-binding protein
MKRREFITLIGGAVAAWPAAARAQQPAMPVVGFLGASSAGPRARVLDAFRQGLGEFGYIEGRNVALEYRWADNSYDQLSALAADLVRRRVTVIAASDAASSLAAKAATTTIPIVFETATDPIAVGLVTSLNRPGGNLTGVLSLSVELGPKRLELLHELIPSAAVVGLLVNPTNRNAEILVRDLQDAARVLGVQVKVLNATTERDLDAVFAGLAHMQAGALVIGPDPFFTIMSEQIATLVQRYAVPAIYQPDELRSQPYGRLPAGRRLYRPDSKGREAKRSPGAAIYESRADHQPQERQGVRSYVPADIAWPRRRSDRIIPI